jgi:hypothetical protein
MVSDEMFGALGSSGMALLDVVPTAILIHDSTGRPYFANRQARMLLGGDAGQILTLEQLAASCEVYVADTDTRYPLECLPVVTAFSSIESRVDDMEIHFPTGQFISKRGPSPRSGRTVRSVAWSIASLTSPSARTTMRTSDWPSRWARPMRQRPD